MNVSERIRQGWNLLRQAVQINPPLALLGVGSFVLTVGTVVGIVSSAGTVLNEPMWLKPMKFAVSTLFYSFTLLGMLRYIQGHRRIVAGASWVIALGMVTELVIIGFQASQGERSHFNNTSPLNEMLFSVMGTVIMTVWMANLVAAILLIRQKMSDRAYGLSLKWGITISLVGAALGMLMTFPTAAQLEQAEATGQPMPYIGAHNVGVPDGGAGLPIVRWSTEGGDLRVGHFIGLHGLQILPLLGWLISRRARSLNEGRRVGLVWVAGLGYLGLTGLTTWQALRGQPLLAPDALTLAALALLLGTAATAGALLARPTEGIQPALAS